MDDNFVIQWLRDYFNKPSLNEQKLTPVLHFSLLWNLFEHTYFTDDKHLNPERLLDLSDLSNAVLSDEILNKTFVFFKMRYFSKDNNSFFESLRLSSISISKKEGQPSYSEFCKSTLTKQDPTKTDKIKTVLLIIHRFRNNLFHGRKKPETLNIYEVPFKEINKFLIHFIEVTAKNNSINNQRQIN